MPRTLRKQLTCPGCGVVIADATYTRWPGRLVLLSPEGVRLQPESVGLQLRRARDEHDTVRAEFLERHLEELVFDLRCRNGHRTLRTMPQLARAVRAAGGTWVDLG
jgi:hypothetical protein